MKLLIPIVLFILISAWVTQGCKNQMRLDKSPHVLQFYPSSDTLPSNLLRLYVQYSEAMKTVNNLEQIKLLDQSGEEIKGAIFNNTQELWDSEQKQLTLILDPARVKTGLEAHETYGRALKPGNSYTLVIEGGIDIYNNTIDHSFSKRFYVAEPDTIIPGIDAWEVYTPELGSNDPVKIKFPEIVDYLSLLNRLTLLDPDNTPVQGEITAIDNEKVWLFSPIDKWLHGHYRLIVNNRLEDPAGNNLNGLFDHDIGSLNFSTEGLYQELSFQIK